MGWFEATGVLALVIPIIVMFLKKVPWIGTTWAPLCAFLLGVIGAVVGFYLGFAPEGTTLVQAIIIGIGIGGASTGLYDMQKQLFGNKKT